MLSFPDDFYFPAKLSFFFFKIIFQMRAADVTAQLRALSARALHLQLHTVVSKIDAALLTLAGQTRVSRRRRQRTVCIYGWRPRPRRLFNDIDSHFTI